MDTGSISVVLKGDYYACMVDILTRIDLLQILFLLITPFKMLLWRFKSWLTSCFGTCSLADIQTRIDLLQILFLLITPFKMLLWRFKSWLTSCFGTCSLADIQTRIDLLQIPFLLIIPLKLLQWKFKSWLNTYLYRLHVDWFIDWLVFNTNWLHVEHVNRKYKCGQSRFQLT
jgi:hypothetical protein